MSSPHIKLHDSVMHQSLKHNSLISLLNYTTERDIGVAVFWFEDNVLTKGTLWFWSYITKI